MKSCSKCKEIKPFEEFSKKASTKSGLQPQCKKCQSEYTREYNRKNKEEVLRKNRERNRRPDFIKKRKEYLNSPHAKYLRYKNSAKNTGRVFEFTEEKFIELFWKKPCTYCGESIESVGVDRVDSSLGYTENNSVPCCEDCNRLKMDRNYDDWVNKMVKILKHKLII